MPPPLALPKQLHPLAVRNPIFFLEIPSASQLIRRNCHISDTSQTLYQTDS